MGAEPSEHDPDIRPDSPKSSIQQAACVAAQAIGRAVIARAAPPFVQRHFGRSSHWFTSFRFPLASAGPIPATGRNNLSTTLHNEDLSRGVGDESSMLEEVTGEPRRQLASGQLFEASADQPTLTSGAMREQNKNIYPTMDVAGISKSAARNLCIEFCTNATLPTGTYDGAPFHYCMARCMEIYGH